MIKDFFLENKIFCSIMRVFFHWYININSIPEKENASEWKVLCERIILWLSFAKFYIFLLIPFVNKSSVDIFSQRSKRI